MRREWQRTGRPIYYPSLGICARNHEDGGTIVPCPAGVGPATAAPGRAAPRPPRRPTGRPTPRAAPRPPTADEIPCPSLPQPRLHRDPDHEGVTGMEIWLWAGPHTVQRSTSTIRGFRVTCTARPEQWRFEPGDGAVYRRSSPGARPPRHAAEHIYERKGPYTQRLVVRWRLETTAGTRYAERSTARSYRVVEVRGALVQP